MARSFTRASLHRLDVSQAIVAAAPLTMAAWFYANDITTEHTICSISDTGGTTDRFAMLANGDLAGDPIRASARASDSPSAAATSTSYSASTWQHACAVFASSTSRSAYLNGGGKVTDTNSRTPAGLDSTSVGVLLPLIASYMDGLIAELGIWNVALTDAEVASLAKGYSPASVRPQSLVSHWMLLGNTSPEVDLRTNKFNLTVTGATKAAHCRILNPGGAR